MPPSRTSAKLCSSFCASSFTLKSSQAPGLRASSVHRTAFLHTPQSVEGENGIDVYLSTRSSQWSSAPHMSKS
jgi:hypothetical protein